MHEVGHLIGLGHGGPYNGDVDPATQQYGPLDSRLWSIMSYISPDDQTAKYYGDYPVTGTNWGNAEVSVTPQMIDVRAVQRLYGLPTNTPLDGGQVFGFHTNLTGAIAPYFDFTINTHPVVTLWDEGDGNTLDLSGFGKAATVNLNPGTFSSADGMVNNIGIAYDTRIDTVIGGGGNDLFVANADNDTIDGGGGMNAVKFNYAEKNYSVSQQSADVLVTNVRTGAVDKLTNIHELVFTDGTMVLDHTGNEGATMVSADMIGTGGSPSFLSSGSSAPAFSAPSDPGTGQSWLTDMLAASGSIAPATSDWFSAPPIGGHVDLATVLHEVPLLVGISHGSA